MIPSSNTEAAMLSHRLTIGNREYQITENLPGVFVVGYQPINARTGKPWQAQRDFKVFKGDRAKAQALRHWLYTVNAARKAAGA
jgi:hypothetical protein